MNIDSLNDNTIRRYIPNILTEVEGEIPLADKLAPFIDSARLWLEREYLGQDDFLSEAHDELALKILVTKAFADAVPSLDLIITPTGFGIVNTDNMAPASKERAERLVASLRSYVDANLAALVDICRTYECWRSSERGRYFCSTFLSSLSDIAMVPSMKNDSYDLLRMCAGIVENAMAERYLGRELMATLRDKYNSGELPSAHRLISAIRSAIAGLLDMADGVLVAPMKLWHAVRPILNELNYFPEYKTMWDGEMGELFHVPGFVNNIKGGFYF